MIYLIAIALAALAVYLALVWLDGRRAKHSYCKRMQRVGC
jgi:hypothetical protein